MLLIVVCPFVLFLLAIVLSVLLRYTDSDCPFGIFKHFFSKQEPLIYAPYLDNQTTNGHLWMMWSIHMGETGLFS